MCQASLQAHSIWGLFVRDKGGSWKSALICAIRSQFWRDESGQDIAEYAVMLAVILLLVVGTIKLIGTNANSTFSNVASTIQ